MYTGVAVNGLVSAWAVLWGRRYGAPAGFTLGGVGFLLAVFGAVLDEWWHTNVGKDVNLWSPPHLVGLAGTVLIAVGLVFALAQHTRYGLEPRSWAPRVLLLFAFADLVHKAMVALDHYTLDPWGRPPDFYPFLLALLLPAILVTAARALGLGAATATAVVFTAQHVLILLVLLAFGMRIPTFTPIPILPALVFWEALLPDDWREPGTHRAYQEAIVDGHGIPIGPAWCARAEATLERELGTLRFGLAINGEPVDLARYPTTRRRMRDGAVCQWIGVSAASPRPGFQELVYTVERDALPLSSITVKLNVKEP